MNLNCQETVRKVYEYLDGELDYLNASVIRKHLERCPKCRQVYAGMGEWTVLLRESLIVEQPAEGFTDRLMLSVKECRIKKPILLPVRAPFPENRYPFSGKGSEAEPWEQAWTSLEPLRQLWFTISHYSHNYYLNLTMDGQRREVHAG